MGTETEASDAADGKAPAIRRIRPWITTVARVALAAVLAFAGWTKATEPPALQQLAVEAYQILPESLAGPVGIGLPIFELALAALLLLGLATRVAGGIAGLLMVVFIAGIISAWTRGLAIDCGCFGGGGTVDPGQTRYLQEILRDLGFLALASWIAVFPRSVFAFDRWFGLYGDDAPGAESGKRRGSAGKTGDSGRRKMNTREFGSAESDAKSDVESGLPMRDR